MRKFRFGLKLILALTLVGAFFVAVVTLANSNKVYADEGFFTNSIIKGSNIYAANIYGTGPNGAALSIHDTT